MSQIDDVVAAVGNRFHHLSATNWLRLMDTPRVWGLPFGRQIMDQARARQLEFQRALEEIVQKTRFRCDIASLNAPDVDWLRVVLGAIDTCLSTRMGRTQPVQFRFLVGQTPMVPVGKPDNFIELEAALIRLVRDRSAYWEQPPEFWLGRFYRLQAGILSAVQAKVFGSAIIGADDIKMTWNHTKAVAADGCQALVGGHNLNMDLFRSYPPVHDVSVVVHGGAAFGVQSFLNQMWQCGNDLLSKERLELRSRTWVEVDNPGTAPTDPLASPAGQAWTAQAQQALADMHASGRQPGTDPVVPVPPPPAVGRRANDLQAVAEVHQDAFPMRLFWQACQGLPQYRPSTRVLSLGKYWSGSNDGDYQAASETMKRTLILGAKRVIRMSQMDLVSGWKKYWKDHVVCQWLLEALLANTNLKVQVVVSPLDAGAGAEGDQYSFGSGAVRTYALMEYYMTHAVDTDAPIPDPDGSRRAALARLEIAPMYYTDQVPADRMVEGETYKWPGLNAEGYTATLKQPPLSVQPPRAGVIGSAVWSAINASGYIGSKVPSAPGNHAKIMIIDDEAYVIGSDNLYPGFLSEFDYLVEGPQAVRDLVDNYWGKLWQYSGPHRINAVPDHPPSGGQPSITSVVPAARVAAGYGQLLQIRGSAMPDLVEFSQGGRTYLPQWTATASPTLAAVRLPFELQPGPATVRLMDATRTAFTQEFPIMVSEVPGMPVITAVVALQGMAAVDTVSAGQKIAIGAEGMDTTGAVIEWNSPGQPTFAGDAEYSTGLPGGTALSVVTTVPALAPGRAWSLSLRVRVKDQLSEACVWPLRT